jgi:Membrane carboxypeptidase/penicillin-binding protein PbpC
VTDALSDAEIRWKNFSRGNPLELDFAAAAKTGTSQEFRDNWVVGFSPQFLVGVWAGNANGAPLFAVSGVAGAGPIWNKIMRLLHQNFPPQKFEFSGKRKKFTKKKIDNLYKFDNSVVDGIVKGIMDNFFS